LFELLKKVFIKGGWAADGQGKSMADKGVPLGKRLKLTAQWAAYAYPVLRRYL
jgi:hypothetical protein